MLPSNGAIGFLSTTHREAATLIVKSRKCCLAFAGSSGKRKMPPFGHGKVLDDRANWLGEPRVHAR